MKKIVVFVPEDGADKLREAIGKAGGGKIGNYTHCSFSIKGVGRFLPMDGAHPAIGKVGELEAVNEERIEFVCEEEKLDEVIQAIKANHPYEEIPIDIYELADLR